MLACDFQSTMVTFGPDFPDFPDFLSNFGRIVFDTVGAAGFALPCLGPETLGIVSLKGRVTDAKQKTNGRLWVPFKPGANKT